MIIGVSLSEPHIVVISMSYVRVRVHVYVYTSLSICAADPIVCNRISTWKIGILFARVPTIKLRRASATCTRPRSGRPMS